MVKTLEKGSGSSKMVGILNITPDSFSDGGKFFSLNSAIAQTIKMIEDGAMIIDIGAESTRPKSIKIGPDEEWFRLEKILPAVILVVRNFNQKNLKKVQISIDSYHFQTIAKAYELGVDIINDVSGLVDERIVQFIAARNISTILMHNTPIPLNEELLVNQHLKINDEILRWAFTKILALEKSGVKKSQLIFDVGIGFAKDAWQSIRILKNIECYRSLGLPLYVGHSKKSFLDEVKIAGDRAEKTLLISRYLMGKNIDFLRVHDVKEHTELSKNLFRMPLINEQLLQN